MGTSSFSDDFKRDVVGYSASVCWQNSLPLRSRLGGRPA